MLYILGIVSLLIILSFVLSRSLRDIEKLSAYECGLEPQGNANKIKIKIVHYIIGILYLLFDLEIIFLYPLATTLWLIHSYLGFICIILFFIILTLAFIYEWFTGALEI